MAAFPRALSPIFGPMTDADMPMIMAMEQVSFPTPWSEDTYRRELRNPRASYWVARPQRMSPRHDVPSVLAYGGMWHLDDEAHVTSIATHPDYRRRHLGEWFLIHLIGVAREKGATAVTLEVRVSNLAAQALYVKLGFEVIGLRRGYYQDTKEDARLLSLFHIDKAAVQEMLAARLQAIENEA